MRLSRLFTWVGLTGLLLLGCGDVASRPPDVVLVTWDTVRADHVGPEGRAQGSTPRFDALAREGVRFVDARSPVPITLPAHASLLTGRHPHVHGARDNGFAVDPALPTLAERFQAAGYASAAFVSAAVLDERYGLARGFDVYDDDVSGLPGQNTVPERRGDLTVDRAIAWLEGVEAERPIFLWLHLYDPHRVWQAPEPFSRELPPYPAEIAFSDHQTGRLLDALSASGRLDHAVVALTSDHGEGLSEHGESTHSYFAYDSTLRVPLVFWTGDRVDASVKRGHRVPGPASLVDLTPTLLELAGLAPLPGDGHSLRPQLFGADLPSRALPLESVVPALDYGAAPIFGLFTETNEVWLDLPRRERYDVEADPGQTRNLYDATRDASQADALFARWDRAWPPGRPTLAPDAEARRQLEALGYVSGPSPLPTEGEAVDPKDRIALFDFLSLGAESLTEEAALARCEALLREHGPLPALERFRIASLQATGRSRDALDALAALAERHPDDPEIQRDLAAMRAEREQQQQLADAIRRTRAEQPDHPTATRDLALTLHRLQAFDEAERLYREALSRDPDDDVLRANLARLLVARRAHAEALSVADAGRRGDHDPALDCIAGRILADHLARGGEAVPALRACRAAGGRLSAHSRDVLAGAG